MNIQTGRFGAMMNVHLLNDGPVTLILRNKLAVIFLFVDGVGLGKRSNENPLLQIMKVYRFYLVKLLMTPFQYIMIPIYLKLLMQILKLMDYHKVVQVKQVFFLEKMPVKL